MHIINMLFECLYCTKCQENKCPQFHTFLSIHFVNDARKACVQGHWKIGGLGFSQGHFFFPFPFFPLSLFFFFNLRPILLCVLNYSLSHSSLILVTFAATDCPVTTALYWHLLMKA